MQESCQGTSKPEYTLVLVIANAKLMPKSCQGNYFLQIGKKHLQKLYFVWGLYFDALCERIVLSKGESMKTYIMLVITLTLVNLASRSETILKAFEVQ